MNAAVNGWDIDIILRKGVLSLGKKDDKASKARLANVRKEIDNLKDKLLNVCKRMDIVNVCKRMCAKGCDKNVKQKREALEIYGRDLVEVKLDRVVGASIGCIGATTVDEYSKCVQKHATFVEPRRRTPLSQIEKEWLLQLGDRLHNRVVGQDQAVNAVVDAVVRSRAGFGRPRHPIGSFLFLGPTGVGKTELAKALAEQLFDDENQLVTMYMSQYMEQHSCSSLIGAAPGFVERLTEVVRRRPNSVLLFEEVEKAHISVINKLVYILEDGSLTDGQGRTVDFTNTIIITTSKLGAEHLLSGLSEKCTMQVACDRVMQEVRNHFRPNFWYQLDEVVAFNPLSHEQSRKVARLQIKDVANRLAEKGIALAVTDATLDYIIAESYDPVYGARPITRWIEIKVVSELSRMLIWEEIDENTTVFVDAGPNGSGLVYRVENNDENTTVFVDAGPNGSGLVYRVENNEEIVNAETEVKSDILIQTSKLGAERLPSGLSGKCTKQVARDRVMQEVRNYFRPNFLYELDEVVVFDPLSLEPLRKVARLQINDVANRLAKKGIALAVTDAALDYVLAESYDPVYGARPIRRWLEKKVVTELSRMLIREEIDENTTVYIDAGPNGSGLVYRVENNEEIVNAETGVKSDILIQIAN